jgi:hypothetical protein
MNYSNDFVKLVKNCDQYTEEYLQKREPSPYFIGYGNPNAEILILGKEKGFSDKNEVQLLQESIMNPRQWLDKISGRNNTNSFDPEMPYGKEIAGLPEGHTWNKYQKLNNAIYINGSFKENFFISELNYKPSKYSRGFAQNKKNIQTRLVFFADPFFTSQFKVTILACGNYIRPKEIYSTFNCDYVGDENGKFEFGKGNWFYLHQTSDKKKLIIHTRQLSMNVQNDMLKKMGEVIQKHLQLF